MHRASVRHSEVGQAESAPDDDTDAGKAEAASSLPTLMGRVKYLPFNFGDSDQWAGVMSMLEVRPWEPPPVSLASTIGHLSQMVGRGLVCLSDQFAPIPADRLQERRAVNPRPRLS
jgi:hypothetical protein